MTPVCVVCDGRIGCEFCPGGWVPENEEVEMASALYESDLERYDGLGTGGFYPGAARFARSLGLRPDDLKARRPWA